MNKIIILDNVLDSDSVAEFNKIERTQHTVWHSIEETSSYHKLLDVCKNYVDLSKCVGYQTWSNLNGAPGWHQDKNEALAHQAGIYEFPIVACVYYPNVENLIGGEFYTEDVVITPKTNRMLIFSGDLWHGVKSYTGTRVALAMNPWSHEPLSYREYLMSKIKTVKHK